MMTKNCNDNGLQWNVENIPSKRIHEITAAGVKTRFYMHGYRKAQQYKAAGIVTVHHINSKYT